MKPRFYYLHGFNSDADESSDKVKILKTIGEVILISYDSFDTYDNIMKHLCGLIPEYSFAFGNAAIIGTSLGGFYAAELGKHLGYPCVMINPAWNPYAVLSPKCGQTLTNYKTGEVRTLGNETTESYVGRSFDTDRHFFPLVLLDEGDESLDAKETLGKLTQMKCIVEIFEGGSHRFEHMKEALPHIEGHMHHCEYIEDINI